MPDIDIDFSTEHREQVIQYIYEKYGWERTGMVCNVVTFQPRMAIRQVGKALGFSNELLDRLAKGVDRWFTEDVEDAMTGAVPPPDMRPKSWQQFLELCREVIDFPRHLSIHNGGMLVTGEPLVDIVPVEPATMEGRRVIQFNKDDVEDLGLIKMDMLGLRTLSARSARPQRPEGVRDVQRRGHHRRVPDRVARADADPSPHAAQQL